MPPKKKGKKGKKGKAGARPPPPPPEPDEFDGMATEQLKEQILDLKSRLERAQLDRNQVQLDRVRGELSAFSLFLLDLALVVGCYLLVPRSFLMCSTSVGLLP